MFGEDRLRVTRQFVEPSMGARAHGTANGTKLNTRGTSASHLGAYLAYTYPPVEQKTDLRLLVRFLGGHATPEAKDRSPGLEGRQ